MVHYTSAYDPPYYQVYCSGKWLTPDFEKDDEPLDEIYVSTDGTKYTPEVLYTNCPKCLAAIRKADLKLEPDPED